MNRLRLVVTLFALLCLGGVPVRAAQEQLSIDATEQPSPPARGRGPYPGSATPGHSTGLPIRLEMSFPTAKLRSDRTLLVDFIITNVGSEPLTLPVSVDQNSGRDTVLTLWLTSDSIRTQYARDQETSRQFKVEIVGTSAELYGLSNNLRTLHTLGPNESCRVHASSRVQLNPGSSSITAHAELIQLVVDNSSVSSEVVGTADSETVTATLSSADPPSNINGQLRQEPNKVELGNLKGRVFRSDSNEAISNSYILLKQEKDSPLLEQHFDARTDEKGDFRFKEIPVGKYTVSIYAWFQRKSDIPCQNYSPGVRTVDDGKATLEWQGKSQAFMQIVTIKHFSLGASKDIVKNFDLLCK